MPTDTGRRGAFTAYFDFDEIVRNSFVGVAFFNPADFEQVADGEADIIRFLIDSQSNLFFKAVFYAVEVDDSVIIEAEQLQFEEDDGERIATGQLAELFDFFLAKEILLQLDPVIAFSRFCGCRQRWSPPW